MNVVVSKSVVIHENHGVSQKIGFVMITVFKSKILLKFMCLFSIVFPYFVEYRVKMKLYLIHYEQDPDDISLKIFIGLVHIINDFAIPHALEDTYQKNGKYCTCKHDGF